MLNKICDADIISLAAYDTHELAQEEGFGTYSPVCYIGRVGMYSTALACCEKKHSSHME
jgi:hypothetical protein